MVVHGWLQRSVENKGVEICTNLQSLNVATLHLSTLVFFRLSGRKIGHVGIYVGGDRFVHAPQSGGHVRVASLDDEIFRRGFAGAGRFLP